MILTCIVSFGLITAFRHAANVSKFGPKNCVEISQSKNKTCVFSTNCKKEDITEFEFAFTCTTSDNEVAKHSFGLGGFDEKETFDTEVPCETCGPPPEAVPGKVVMKRRNANVTPHRPKEKKPDDKKKKPKKITKHVTNLHSKAAQDPQEEKKSEEKKEEEVKPPPVEDEVEMKEDDAEWYKLVLKESQVETGPDNCVSIFRKKESSTCVIHTDCEKEKMDSYEFGLDCVDKNNMQVRHLFGRDSFLPNEWFDTLITCNLCLANSYSDTDSVQMDARLDKLEKSVTKLKDTMTTLEDKVDKVAKAEAPESDTPAKTDDENENPDEPAKKEEEAPEPQQFMVKRPKEADDVDDDENEKAGKRTKMVLKNDENEDEEDEEDEK